MIITLTTDFGLSGPFAGIMKGVILSIAPNVRLVDVSHDIASYDILEGAFVLGSACGYFPPGTIHLAVVDPGVGSARRPLAVWTKDYIFIGPDNGIFSLVLTPNPPAPPPAVYHITNERLFLNPVSQTFHGRDVFAPVAAHLACGMPIDSVGPRVSDFVRTAVPQPVPSGENRLLAEVIRIDKYGNIVTNIRAADLKEGFCIHIGNIDVTRVCSSYAEGAPGEVFVIEGSAGYVEVAVKQGSAAGKLQICRGAEIKVETGRANH